MQKYYDKDTLIDLKEKLPIEDYVSQYMDLKPRHGKLFGLCPFHNEDTPSFMIDISNQSFHCFGCRAGGDIFSFVMKFKGIGFKDAVEEVAKEVGISIEPKQLSNTLKILKSIDKLPEHEAYNHAILDKALYEKYPDYVDKEWVEEGIQERLFEKYEIKLDETSNRIIYPVYDNCGNFINIKGRTKYSDFKLLKIPKYINYFKVGKMDYLQGLHLNEKYIKEKKEIIIFEGLKSCMKAEGYGYNNVVSSETAGLTFEQIEVIISLKCNVVIAFDKDKSLGDYLDKNLKLLSRFATLYYIDDDENLLGDKEEKNSPVDKGKEVWDYLYQHRKEVIAY